MSNHIKWTQEQTDEIVRLYTEEKWSLKKIGRKFGKDNGVIRRVLDTNGIKVDKKRRRTPDYLWTNKDIENIINLYHSGLSYRTIAEQYPCHANTIQRLLKKHSTKIRQYDRSPNKVKFIGNTARLEIISKGKKYICLIDKEDYDRVKNHRWSYSQNGYVRRNSRCKVILLHREILNPPNGYITDHINRNPLDNRRCNLRIATYSENARNTR